MTKRKQGKSLYSAVAAIEVAYTSGPVLYYCNNRSQAVKFIKKVSNYLGKPVDIGIEEHGILIKKRT